MSYTVTPITCRVIRPSNCPYGSIPLTIRNVFVNGDMRVARLMLAVGALLWALFLVWPYALDSQLFPTSAQVLAGRGRLTYSVMAQIMPEWMWAFGFGMHGLFMLISVFYKVNPIACVLDAFNGAAFWTAATVSCYLAHFCCFSSYHPPAAMGMDVAAVIASWWWFVRTLANPKYEADN